MGGHLQTGPTLTVNTTLHHSRIHRLSPQVQESNRRTLQGTIPSTTASSNLTFKRPWLTAENYHHHHEQTKAFSTILRRTSDALWASEPTGSDGTFSDDQPHTPEMPNNSTGEAFPSASFKALRNREWKVGHRLTTSLDTHDIPSHTKPEWRARAI